jgi:hypothetical protein
MSILDDVRFPDGADNMAGITKSAFVALVSSFATLAKPIAVPVVLGDKSKIITAHVLKAAEKVHKVTVLYDKSGVESALVGGTKSHSWKPKLKLMYCGTEAEILDFVTLIQNAEIVAWAEPLDGTGLIQIGSEALPAYLVSGSVKTGEGPEGEKGVTFEVEAPSRTPWYIYTAALPRLGV